MVLLVSVALIAAGIASAGCAGEQERAGAAVQRIVDELAAQRYGPATARYQQDEELVLGPAAAPAWRRAMRHQDDTVRQWAIDALARIGEAQDVELLVATLDDPFRRVQEAAAEGLIRLDAERAREVFAERLLADDPLAASLAAQSLADMGAADAVPLLLSRLEDDDLDAGVRGVMANSLGILADARAVEPLARLALDGGESVQLRRTAAEALAMLESPEAQPFWQRLADSDDSYISELARRALQQ